MNNQINATPSPAEVCATLWNAMQLLEEAIEVLSDHLVIQGGLARSMHNGPMAHPGEPPDRHGISERIGPVQQVG